MKLVLSCSATKRPAKKHELVPFAQLYDGPMWRQVRAAMFPHSDLAAVSALYGFLEPHTEIETYDLKMDEKSAREFIKGSHLYRLAQFCAGERVVMFGGQHYRSIGIMAKQRYPAECKGLEFATGSFLEQRKRLGHELRVMWRPRR